jgi:hypothetical protein
MGELFGSIGSAEVNLQAPQKSSGGIRKLLVDQPKAEAVGTIVVALSVAPS